MKTLFCLLCAITASAQFIRTPLTPGADSFLAFNAPVVALEHVRVIDGTGAAPMEDQTIVIDNGKIASIGGAIPEGAHRLDLSGQTVIPGLVGMHEHLFYPSGGGVALYIGQGFSYPRLYLACGVTTARTAGTMEPQTDLSLKRMIDEGKMPGPNLLVTVGYLEGKGSFGPQMAELADEEDARRFVEYWASQGAHSFKAYMNITRAELEAAIQSAHARGLKVTGHLCSVGYREAAAMGIDNIEHGLVEDMEFRTGRKPDSCMSGSGGVLRASDPQVQEMIRDLVERNVAITSTLAVYEPSPAVEQRFVDALAPSILDNYLKIKPATNSMQNVTREAEFERAFVKAGGLLMAGSDPTGLGGVLAGFGNQRGIELLVVGGFTPLEAIQIATLNGARFLGMDDRIGSIAAGKQADLVVIDGNPAAQISDIRKVRLVFKAGAAYDPARLIDSVRGQVGLH
jgi:imidazolonepropionase-like amidohydrolase